MKSQFNLDGTPTQLRSEICLLQKDLSTIKACQREFQSVDYSDCMAGFWIAFLFVGIFLLGHIIGTYRSSNSGR